MPGPDTPALSVEHLTAGYGAEPVVHEVNLSVSAGEVVGLIGPNGSGKTTIVRAASRALRPRSGRITVAGRDPYEMSARESARLIAVVPQDLQPAFSFTVLELTLMGRSPYLSRLGGGEARDWALAREAMVATSVQHLADRPVEELSGGERRRAILAQALAQDAPLLLLDEPTTHMDLRHVLELLSIVRDLAERRGKAILAILHDLNLAASSCDRIVALHRGRVVAEGSPGQVLTDDLLRDVWEVEAEVQTNTITGRPSVSVGPARVTPTPLGRRAHVIGGAGRGAPLMRRLAEQGFAVSAGVLHATDTDATVAERLNILRVSVPPFSEIDPESVAECRAMIERADLLVVCDAPYGPGNLANLELALEAARSGTRTVLLEQVAIEERDFTSGRATALWSELRHISQVVKSPEELVL